MGQFWAFFAASNSSSPGGEPWAAAVSCLVGSPYPICVLQIISVGRESFFAFCIARSTASTSFPSSTLSTCQP